MKNASDPEADTVTFNQWSLSDIPARDVRYNPTSQRIVPGRTPRTIEETAMNRKILTLAAVASLVFAETTSAQNPYADYNRARAYAHFANSTAPVKSFSSIDAARTWGYDTPFESVRFTQSPGYYHELASNRYGQSYYSDPGAVSGVVVPRYLYPSEAVRNYYDPGQGYLITPPVDYRFNGYPQPTVGLMTAPGANFPVAPVPAIPGYPYQR